LPRPFARPALPALVLLLVPLLLALSPELNMDCLRYHLSLPEHMLRRHGLVGGPVPLGWSITAAADYPNAVAQLAGLDAAVRVVRPFLALAGALALALALAGPGAPAGALILPALVAVVVPVESWQVIATGKNDAVVCGTMLAAAAVLLGPFTERPPAATAVLSGQPRARLPIRNGPPQSGESGHSRAAAALLFGPGCRGRRLVAGGVLLGLGFAAKAVTAGLAVALVATALLRRGSGRRVGGAGWLALGALPAVVPWAGLSFAVHGDPFHPAVLLLFPRLFGGSTDVESFRRAYEGFLYRTMRPSEWPGVLAGLTLRNSFPFLAALPVLLLRPNRSRLVAGTAGLAGLLLVMFQLPGFYFSERFGYPAQALMNVAGLVALSGTGFGAAPAAALGAAAMLRVGVALSGAPAEVTPLAFHSGRMTPGSYFRAGTGAYGAILDRVRAAVKSRDGLIVSGETLTLGLPGRVLSSGYGPPPMWQAAAESLTEERMAVRLRQWRARFILHNLPLALVERYQATAWRWNERSLTLYRRFVANRTRVIAFSGRCDPGFGSDWLLEVFPRREGRPGSLLFLPGAESVYSAAAQAQLGGHAGEAVAHLAAVRRRFPGIALTDSLLANALVAEGRHAEAYPLARSSVASGLVDETNVMDWMVAAAKTGRRAEAERALARAKEVYPLWPGRVREAELRAGLGRP
jgi:hypothetical protein